MSEKENVQKWLAKVYPQPKVLYKECAEKLMFFHVRKKKSVEKSVPKVCTPPKLPYQNRYTPPKVLYKNFVEKLRGFHVRKRKSVEKSVHPT